MSNQNEFELNSSIEKKQREFVYGTVERVSKLAWKLQDLKINVSGSENIPANTAGIIAVNHVSYVDFLFAGLPAYERHRKIRYVVNHKSFQHWAANWLLKSMRHISLDQSKGMAGLDDAKVRLNQGQLVGIFPEGHVSRSFEVEEFKLGTAKLAIETKTAIIPVAVWGTQRLMAPNHRKNFGRSHIPVGVKVGQAIYPDLDAVALTAKCRESIKSLVADLQQEYPDSPVGAWWAPRSQGGTAPSKKINE